MNKATFAMDLFVLCTNVLDILLTETNLSFQELVSSFYHSNTYKLLEDKENGYWWFSPLIIADDFMKEVGLHGVG